ncbi:MAG: hypothetical protein II126_00330 [Erysipelotrichaceae bacterium]|nr:hypothetical protein [Erysipelotrichaceae bacterium]
MLIRWINGFEITVRTEGGEVIIEANREGMLSLANQLLDLADAQPGTHIHYDQYNSLEEGSAELVICRVEGSQTEEEI